jgi:hypothetical protein
MWAVAVANAGARVVAWANGGALADVGVGLGDDVRELASAARSEGAGREGDRAG